MKFTKEESLKDLTTRNNRNLRANWMPRVSADPGSVRIESTPMTDDGFIDLVALLDQYNCRFAHSCVR